MGSVATFASSRVTCPEKPGSTKPAVAWVSSPSRPSDDFPSTRAATSSGRVTISGVQDEGLVAVGLDLAGEVGLVRSRVDVRVAMVLEDPEVPVQPDVDRRGLHHRGVEGVHRDPTRLDLGQHVAV